MIKSMTGFGRGEFNDEKRCVTVEIKAVNHRYSDITVKMPRRYAFAEDAIKNIVKGFAPRGKIDVMINVNNADADDTDIQLNLPLAKQYYEKLTELSKAFPEVNNDISIRTIASLPDVIKSEAAVDDEEQFLNAVTAATSEAGKTFTRMREVEGAKLIEDILMRGNLIEQTVLEVEKYAPQVAENYTVKMKERITELLGNSATIPEDRIMLEAAVFADKSNITEELVRLKSHVSQLRKLTDNPGQPVGKQLDFLVQEMNREANTIGSKANDINITNNVLVLKAEIEKIREQIQNIE